MNYDYLFKFGTFSIYTHTTTIRSSLYFFAIVIVRTNTDGNPKNINTKLEMKNFDIPKIVLVCIHMNSVRAQ